VDVTGQQPVISVFADSLNYIRTEPETQADPATGRIFVFKGSSEVEDTLYETIETASDSCNSHVLLNFRKGFTTAIFNQEIFLVGGYDGFDSWTDDSTLIDSTNLSESITTSIFATTERSNTLCTQNGSDYFCGGGLEGLTDSVAIEAYDLESQQTFSVGNNSQIKIDATFTAIGNGIGIIAGGTYGGTYLAEVEVYDAYAGSVIETNDWLIYPRYQHSATLLDDGRVLIVGGAPSQEASITAEILDLEARSSTLLPWKLHTPRFGHSATLLPDGRVLIVGGNGGDSTVEIFNPMPD
jgi:hypothetical protein